jgi:hypothetical protein
MTRERAASPFVVRGNPAKALVEELGGSIAIDG